MTRISTSRGMLYSAPPSEETEDEQKAAESADD